MSFHFPRLLSRFSTIGWRAVQRDVMINYDLEKSPLEIKMDGDKDLDVTFYSASRLPAGGVWIRFYIYPDYAIYQCKSYSLTRLPSNLPSNSTKLWRITLTRDPTVRLQLHCNGVNMADILMSNSTCSYINYSKYWSREVAKIKFSATDTASDFYRPGFFASK